MTKPGIPDHYGHDGYGRDGSGPDSYGQFLTDLKGRIRAAQLRASMAVNRELVLLLLADRPRYSRPAGTGKLGPEDRIWYVKATIQHGWSRNVLVHQIESGRLHRQGKAVANFDRTLPAPQSDLARDITKDPYNFDFLTLGDDAHERDLERGLLVHLRQFLLELGVGFAFVGSQYRLAVGDQEFYIDLLFYHLKLRAYVVIDLKMRAFEPEFAGKMNFYLSVVNDLLRHPDDQPSIGLILCKTKAGLSPNTRSGISTSPSAFPNTGSLKVFLKS